MRKASETALQALIEGITTYPNQVFLLCFGGQGQNIRIRCSSPGKDPDKRVE